MDSRCAVHDLPTAPRLGAFGLTRLRLPTAVEKEVNPNPTTNAQALTRWCGTTSPVCCECVRPKID